LAEEAFEILGVLFQIEKLLIYRGMYVLESLSIDNTFPRLVKFWPWWHSTQKNSLHVSEKKKGHLISVNISYNISKVFPEYQNIAKDSWL